VKLIQCSAKVNLLLVLVVLSVSLNCQIRNFDVRLEAENLSLSAIENSELKCIATRADA